MATAAYYGQTLLQQNSELREQLAQTQAATNGKVVRSADYEHYRERALELEGTVADLQGQLAAATSHADSEERSFQRRLRAAEEAAHTATAALALAKADQADADARVAALEISHVRLADELQKAKVAARAAQGGASHPGVGLTDGTGRWRVVA